MSEIKLTKNELREQQLKLAQLQRYLPTLQLKKMMLQMEVNHAAAEIALLKEKYLKEKEGVESFSSLLTDKEGSFLFDASVTLKVEEEFENIAGADVP
ncbi:MAG: V-type ATP synthase subunit D, partial [Simkania negevensis]|nr:V-type ATP synthase subunit D [Simkania negevensis]